MNQMNPSTSNQTETEAITSLPSQRLEARMLGMTKYYTGKPCHKGHVTYRYVSSGMCAKCSSDRAKMLWNAGVRQEYKDRPAIDRKWNASIKAKESKAKWKESNPKRAWAVYATGGAKGRANLKGIPFSITSKYVLSITPDSCPVFGTPFSFIYNKHIKPESASLDRLDPNKGYVEGNVVVISVKANMIKNAYTSDDVAAVAAWMRTLGL